jgi:hypothetical protein
MVFAQTKLSLINHFIQIALNAINVCWHYTLQNGWKQWQMLQRTESEHCSAKKDNGSIWFLQYVFCYKHQMILIRNASVFITPVVMF